MKFSKVILGSAVIAAVAATAGSAMPALAARQAAASPVGVQVVYQGKVVGGHIVLGPAYAPTVLASTRPLPAGTYLVTATVGAVIASHDQIVCAAYIPNANDGVFGTAGNPGTGGIYGTAAMTDTITVSAGQHISVTCNAFNYGKGTYAGDAVLEAVPVARVR